MSNGAARDGGSAATEARQLPTIQDVVAGLAAWAVSPNDLIGLFESQELEFKMKAYQLSTAPGKSEFAKDIGGMANAGGGLIVLGIETEGDDAVGRDRSVRLRPLGVGAIVAAQMEDVARTWLYPPQRRLDIKEWPNDAGEMLVSILIPAHDDPGGLVLVLGPGDPPDRRTIGAPIRSQSRVDFHSAAEVYDWIRRARLQREPLARAPAPAPAKEADDQLGRARVEFVEADPSGAAVFVLQAWPAAETHLDRVHDRDGVRGLFLDPPPQRPAGFGWWGLPPDTDGTGGVRVSSDRVALWITPTAIATLVVSQEYLTFGMDRHTHPGTGPLINSIALGELVWEFVRAYRLILRWADTKPAEVLFRIGLFRAREPLPLLLGRGRADDLDYGWQPKPSATEDFIDTLGPFDCWSDDADGLITARLLRRIYMNFGLGSEHIPHLSDEGRLFVPDSLERRPRGS